MSAPSGRRSVSVVVCTYASARAAQLARLLDALGVQAAARDEVIVVVDHNDDLLETLRAAHADAVVIPNHHPRGLSGARNTGLESATREIVAFIDDDAVPAADWLDRLTAAYDDPRVAGAGGAVAPAWDGLVPRWFPPEFGWVVGCGYRGLPTSAQPVRNFIGCNMSFRRAALEGGEGFRADLGRIGLRPVGCEETEFCIRLAKARRGTVLWFDPEARVDHLVPRDRMTWAYFRSRCYAEGRSKALVSRAVGAGSALESERAYAVRVLSAAIVSDVLAAVRGDAGGLGRAAAIVAGFTATALGYAAGLVETAFARRPSPAAHREVARQP